MSTYLRIRLQVYGRREESSSLGAADVKLIHLLYCYNLCTLAAGGVGGARWGISRVSFIGVRFISADKQYIVLVLTAWSRLGFCLYVSVLRSDRNNLSAWGEP